MDSEQYLQSVNAKPLTGSEKQIEWARTLRYNAVDSARREIFAAMSSAERSGADKADPAKFETQKAQLLAALDKLSDHAEAKFWIDSRGKNVRDLLALEMGRGSN